MCVCVCAHVCACFVEEKLSSSMNRAVKVLIKPKKSLNVFFFKSEKNG